MDNKYLDIIEDKTELKLILSKNVKSANLDIKFLYQLV